MLRYLGRAEGDREVALVVEAQLGATLETRPDLFWATARRHHEVIFETVLTPAVIDLINPGIDSAIATRP
jgi:hypothetical protein